MYSGCSTRKKKVYAGCNTKYNSKKGRCSKPIYKLQTTYHQSPEQYDKCIEMRDDYSCDPLRKKFKGLDKKKIIQENFKVHLPPEIKVNEDIYTEFRTILEGYLNKILKSEKSEKSEESKLKSELKKILNFEGNSITLARYNSFKDAFPNLFDAFESHLNSLSNGEYPIQNDQTIYQENPDSEENLSLQYNPNLQPMQQLPVAVQQPVAVQPVAVQPVAVQPVAVQPVAVQPVAVQPVAVQPVAQQ
jgi:hypothetical protein